jgi:membrane protease YdiL (CAAX protease family)
MTLRPICSTKPVYLHPVLNVCSEPKKLSMTGRKLAIYIGVVFLVSWTIQVVAISITRDFSSSIARLMLTATMVSPLLVTIGFILADRSLGKRILWKPNKHILGTSLLAVIIPTINAFMILFLMQGMHFGTSGWFGFSAEGAAISGGPFLLGLGKQSWLFFMLNILVTAIAFSVLTGLLAIGEEFAWRGLLQGELINRFGMFKGIVVLGFLWAIWHLPIQLAGYNYPETPILGSFLLSPLMLISVSFFYAWLTLKSGSFIPAAIAHGAFNTIEQGIISNIKLDVPMLNLILVKLVVTAITGLFFLYLLKRKRAFLSPTVGKSAA